MQRFNPRSYSETLQSEEKKLKLAFLSLKKFVYEPGLHSQQVTITKKQIDWHEDHKCIIPESK